MSQRAKNLPHAQSAWIERHERLHAEALAEFKQRALEQSSPPEPQIITAAEVEACIRKAS
jgi:hypothetical protein